MAERPPSWNVVSSSGIVGKSLDRNSFKYQGLARRGASIHMSIRLLINGARGRMGAQISRMAGEDSRFCVVAQRDAGDADPPRDAALDVVIDFSSDAGARDALRLALAHGAGLLVGSTGLTDQTRR